MTLQFYHNLLTYGIVLANLSHRMFRMMLLLISIGINTGLCNFSQDVWNAPAMFFKSFQAFHILSFIFRWCLLVYTKHLFIAIFCLFNLECFSMCSDMLGFVFNKCMYIYWFRCLLHWYYKGTLSCSIWQFLPGNTLKLGQVCVFSTSSWRCSHCLWATLRHLCTPLCKINGTFFKCENFQTLNFQISWKFGPFK